MTPPNKTLAHHLDEVRKDLLDLGLRNPLLNFRQPKGKGLELTHPTPATLFHQLTIDEKSFSFNPPDFQTTLEKDELEKRLLATFYAARTSIEEQGVNTLFLALGMLRWLDEASDKWCRAPLILIPVELDRKNAHHSFTLRFNGEDPGDNESLIEKLKQEFGLKFPRLPADDTELDIAAYFQQVSLAVSSKPTWTLEPNAINLGFFSFSKFLMYRDLDPETWTESQSLLKHPLLNYLMGEAPFPAPSTATIGEDAQLDEALKGHEPLLVDNSDSSQTLAIVEALSGRDLVIQGPPGTGKSQTIVNLIAAAVDARKKILFVSEKMAALEVVKRRLDKLKLGDFCLELHSNKTKKRDLIDELRRTVALAKHDAPRTSAELSLLTDHRERLNAYCAAVNEPIGTSEETPSAIYGKLLLIQQTLPNTNELPLIRFADSTQWTAADAARKRALVERLRNTIQQSGPPTSHPFYGSLKRTYLPTENESLGRALKALSESISNLQQTSAALATQLSTPPPDTLQQLALLLGTAKLIAKAPSFDGIPITQPSWFQPWLQLTPKIREVADSGALMHEGRATFGSILRTAAWDTDVTSLRESYARLQPKWWRWLSPQWHQSKNSVNALYTNPARRSENTTLPVLDAILANRHALAVIAQHETQVSQLFASEWRGTDTDFELLRIRLDWILEVDRAIRDRQALPSTYNALPATQNLTAQIADTEAALTRNQTLSANWRTLAEFPPPPPQPLHHQLTYITNLTATLNRFPYLISYNQAAWECNNAALNQITSAVEAHSVPAETLLPLFEKARLIPLLELGFSQRPALSAFDGIVQNQTVDAFRRLDELQLHFCRAAIAARHCTSVPTLTAGGQLGVLAKEFERKARFLPVRRLMEKAGNGIQAIKPVFMMSPLSIANYLPPGSVEFDLAIFDEASQVKPADALGAIVRAKQVVVVGDSKQLPPSSFFESILDNTDASESEEEETAAADIESILGLFSSRGAPQRMLRWHYRSRHESLIAVSNSLFYDNRLVVFPSPQQDRTELGLRFHHLPNAHYDRGGKRTNAIEAATVADAVMAHAAKQLITPITQRETLGVVAFSMAQMDAIRDEVEVLRKRNPKLEDFFISQQNEPFFVKNLENVQGDERDVILISIGYARTAEGYLAMSFGPLNRDGGERRLNVLISRARKRCDVFSNLTADDIDLNRAPSQGVRALKRFLEYAQTGHLEIATPTGRPADSEFEEQVAAALKSRGYVVETQVGCSGFFLDLAVVDPDKPGRYILGIECDGASYHSARSARDRDRLRQAVLEGLGWTIHRIWSTAWFRNHDDELAKLMHAIESAKIDTPIPSSLPAPIELTFSTPVVQPKSPSTKVAPYELARLTVHLNNEELHAVPRAQLVAHFITVVECESPVHWMEAGRRIASAAGVQRIGARIQQAFTAAVDFAIAQQKLHRNGEFLWDLNQPRPTVRDRSALPVALRRIELVAPEELAGAILIVTQDTFGIDLSEIPTEVSRLIGFGRTSEEARQAIEAQIKAMLEQGNLELRGTTVVCTATP